MQCVLPNTILKKCRSEHDAKRPSQCPSEHKAGINLELKQNCSSHTPPTSSKTYPYPKGEHNGAEGPKYASLRNLCNENDNF